MSKLTEAEIALSKQCQYLESLGFVIAHAYGKTIRVCTDDCFRNEVEVKADSKNILLDICMAFHRKGIVEGQNQFRTSLLGMLNDEVY